MIVFMKKNALLILWFVCSLSLAKASPSDSSQTGIIPDKTILDKLWTLRRMQPNDSVNYELDEDAFLLQFNSENNKINGKAPCNTFFGGYNSDYISNIQIMAVGNTRMYCEHMQYEEMYLSLLQKANTFMILKEKLVLLKGKQVLLIFE